jgi:glutaminyl-tRNA synthetase
VDGWDDPRLYTLVGLKRRGVPPEAINRFVRECGVTTATTTIDSRRLDFFIRAYLDETAPRVMAVLEPLPILLTNVPADFKTSVDVPFYPKSKQPVDAKTPVTHKLTLSSRLWIDMSDFRSEADPNFFRLTPNTTVGLLFTVWFCKCALNVSRIQSIVMVWCVTAKDRLKGWRARISIPNIALRACTRLI